MYAQINTQTQQTQMPHLPSFFTSLQLIFLLAYEQHHKSLLLLK